MTLSNLVGKSLEYVTIDHDTIKRLITAAERNIADYSGDTIPESTLKDCIEQSEKLLAHFNKWFHYFEK